MCIEKELKKKKKEIVLYKKSTRDIYIYIYSYLSSTSPSAKVREYQNGKQKRCVRVMHPQLVTSSLGTCGSQRLLYPNTLFHECRTDWLAVSIVTLYTLLAGWCATDNAGVPAAHIRRVCWYRLLLLLLLLRCWWTGIALLWIVWGHWWRWAFFKHGGSRKKEKENELIHARRNLRITPVSPGGSPK